MTVGGAWGRAAVLVVALLAALLTACTPPATPAPAPPPPTAAPQPSQVVVAVDDLGAGFNPHLLAHQSPVTTALAGLVLPSVFRPDADGVLQLDRTVATSAQVTAQDPFTVTYELNLEASWTSNAPIAAEDFVYLWERMRDEPGVVDAAGYRLITDVRSRAAGKAVDVVFAQRYPAWQTLFANLLPAHLLKDAPGSWTGALANGLPASGGPFRVVSVDRARGEILLTRNDQYWDTPAVLDQLSLRRLGGIALADGLGVGDVDIALPTPDDTVRTALGGLQPPPRIQTVPQPVVTELALRTDGGPLADARIRQALAGILDRDAVRAAVAPDALDADSFALAPSQPGYAGTEPGTRAGPDALLGAAGWTRGDDGRWQDGGEPVRLVVGASAERPLDVAVAENVAAQLDAAGIDTTVVAPTGVELFSQATVPPVPPPTTTAPTTDRPDDDHHGDPDPRAHRRGDGHDHHHRDPHTGPRRGGRRRPRGPAADRRRRPRHRARVRLRLRRPRHPERPARPARRCPPPAPRRCSRCSTSCSPTPTAATQDRPGRPSRSCCGRRCRRCRCSSRSRCW